MESDIVTRLRDWAYTICTVNSHVPPSSKAQMAKDAAAEITRLRAELAAMRQQRDAARIRVRELCARMGGWYRRINLEVVECMTPEEIAEVCGWDCFTEKKGGGA